MSATCSTVLMQFTSIIRSVYFELFLLHQDSISPFGTDRQCLHARRKRGHRHRKLAQRVSEAEVFLPEALILSRKRKDVSDLSLFSSKNNKTYAELVYGVHIRRRPLYYIFNVIIPCAMLSCLTCMSFW